MLLALAIYISIIIPIMSFQSLPRFQQAMVFGVYLFVLFLPIIVRRLGGAWFHPLVFHSLWTFARMVLPQTPVYVLGLRSHTALPGYTASQFDTLVSYGLFLETIALLAMYAGFTLFRPGHSRVRLQFSPRKNIMLGLIVAIVVSILAFFVLVRYAGGIEALLFQRGLRRDLRLTAAIGGHWHLLVTFLTTASLVWVGLQADATRRVTFWLTLFVALLMKFIVTGSRGGVLFPILLVLITWAMHRRKLPTTRIIVWALIALVAVAVLGEFRAATSRVQSVEQIQLNASISDYLVRGLETLMAYSTDGNAFYPVIARVPHDVDLLYGASYIAMLAAPVPRAIWPEKPRATGFLASSLLYGNEFNTIPTGSVGEAYWNFHIPGVLIVFFAWGMFLKALMRMLQTKMLGIGTLPIYVLTLWHLSPNAESFYDWLHTIVPAIIFILLFCGPPKILRIRRERLRG